MFHRIHCRVCRVPMSSPYFPYIHKSPFFIDIYMSITIQTIHYISNNNSLGIIILDYRTAMNNQPYREPYKTLQDHTGDVRLS